MTNGAGTAAQLEDGASLSERSAVKGLAVLEAWLQSHGLEEAPIHAEGWQATEFEDALIFSPSDQRRSNRLYLVRGSEVIAFAPSSISLDDAYASLGGGARQMTDTVTSSTSAATPKEMSLDSPSQELLAAELLAISPADAQSNQRNLPELHATYFWESGRGGGALIVGQDGGVLFANSSVPFDTHVHAFASGRRTHLSTVDDGR